MKFLLIGAALCLGAPALRADPIGDAWNDPRNPVRQVFNGERLDLWSLRPVAEPALPETKSSWPSQPLDHFILNRLDSAGLGPSPPADTAVLVRRLYLSLTGLPPSPEDIASITADSSLESLPKLVDHLLASDAFGEHWARWWLDAARYSDSNGYDWDEFRPQAWRYRDYVIRSLNADKPFDQFIREQLAGDEMVAGAPKSAADQDRLIATGFLRVGPWDNSSKLFKEDHKNVANHLADLTETTATVFLGLTMSCCRCHDHKTEPLLQSDHYRLRAFFAGTRFADDLPLDLEPEQEAIRKFNAEIDAKEKDEEKAESLHRPFQTGLIMASENPTETKIFVAGDPDKPGESVEPGIPAVLDPNPVAAAANPSGHGRRTALATWLASPKNPLTARVLVNRTWQAMTGRGLVATPGDFGLSGSRPSHPELLDFLAAQFVREGWSLKKLVRQIALSSTYAQSAYPDPAHATKANTTDAGNALYWRMNPRRLTAEQLRDSMLAVSGLLQPSKGGPPIWPELPESVLAANPAFYDDNAEKTKGWYPSPPENRDVRSIYLVQKRSVRVPFMETFDLPDNFTSCSRRDVSTSATQAYALLNNPLTIACAKALASRSRKEAGDDPTDQFRHAWHLALGRWPSDEEMKASEGLRQRSLEECCRAILNLNEFIYVD